MAEVSARPIGPLSGLEALRALSMPVVLVAALDGEVRVAATATVMYASLRPLGVAVSLHDGSLTQRVIERAGRFSVSILSAGDVDLAIRAGRSFADRDAFRELGIESLSPPDDPDAPPGVARALAVLWCTVEGRVQTGDHWLYTATVDAGWGRPGDGRPLHRYGRTYHGLGHAVAGSRVDGYPL